MQHFLCELAVVRVGRLKLLHKVVASWDLHVRWRGSLNGEVLPLLELVLIQALIEVHLAL